MVELKEQQASLASRHIIERPRLTRLLDETTARVILLVAPAGYGKTTLARQWLAQRPHVWLEGSTALADVAGLIRKLGDALQAFGEPDDGRLIDVLHSVHDLGALEAVAGLQAERISSWPEDAWLAIDEYESIAASEASDAYIEHLLRASKVRLLVTSRVMPRWATSRRRLYGDHLIVSREQLAMTDVEARKVLQGRDAQVVPTLISSAAGWPAVLGLASLSEAQEPSARLPQALYDYLADELFKRAPTSLQSALPQLALLRTVTPDIVAAAFGANSAPEMIRKAKELGFLNGEGSRLSFHPLLRAFLRRKASAPRHEETVDQLLNFLLKSQAWDEAFDVIRDASRPAALVTLFELAHEPLLKSGRTATLAEWLAFAGTIEVHAPLLDVVRAELAIREGTFAYAEDLALTVAEQAEDQRAASRALSIAGRAAHLDNRDEVAFAHFREARERARDDRERHRAVWGALLAAPDFETDDELGVVADTFFRYGTDSADDAVRAATAQFAVGLTRHGLSGVIEPALATLRTFGKSADPLAVTSLLNTLSRALSLAARYEEARDLAEEELDIATSARLQFVVPYGHVSHAAALLGLSHYREAEDSLRLATAHAEDIGDEHNVFDALTVRAKVAVAQGQPDRAVQLTATRADTADLSSGMQADYAATRGLALSCAGRAFEAEEALSEAEGHSSIPEVVAMVACSRAALALREGSAPEGAAKHLEQPLSLMMFEPIVVACRGYPDMISAVKATDRHLPQRLVKAMSARPGPSQTDQLLALLTPREREVLELLTRGYTNREIAATLVIAEVTAKVHVRRVIRKLGVRSRTEAAIAAVENAR
jgi:DNA-binding CsgD family transcriptional regulator/tetratricopeptide (TPR) repeat protein